MRVGIGAISCRLGLVGLGVALTSGGAVAQAESQQPSYLVIFRPGPALAAGQAARGAAVA